DERNLTLTVDLDQISLPAIVLDQRHRLREVDLEPVPGCLQRIVAALIELPATGITNVRPFGREIVYIINIPAGFASLPASDPAEQDIVGHTQEQYIVDLAAVIA